MCKISVVVPVYNVEKYLEECIDSLVVQSYKNFEIILVDDGSTDNSGYICDEYSKKYEFIKVIHKKNEGLGFARNTGIEVAKGEYITFIDSDDYADIDLIKDLYNTIKKTNSDTCLGGFKKVDDNGKILFVSSYEKQIYTGEDVYKNLLPRMIGSAPERSDSIKMSVWNSMYSMDIINKNNIRFPSEREFISEDIMFDIDYYKHSRKVAIIDTYLYNYRTNVNSLTMKYKSDRFQMIKVLYKAIEKKINYMDINVKYRLQRQFFINVRECIKQEKYNIYGEYKKNAIKNIKKICEDELVQATIKAYPIKKLQMKPKIFIYLVKYKMYKLLYILLKVKIF